MGLVKDEFAWLRRRKERQDDPGDVSRLDGNRSKKRSTRRLPDVPAVEEGEVKQWVSLARTSGDAACSLGSAGFFQAPGTVSGQAPGLSCVHVVSETP